MKKMVILVDLENDPKPDWTRVPADALVKLFIGAMEPKDPIKLAKRFKGLVARNEQIRVNGSGKNTLDFRIAYYLGESVMLTCRHSSDQLSLENGSIRVGC